MTTVRELADKLGVTPQTIRRYAKKELGVATKERQPLQLDATQTAAIADHFSNRQPAKTLNSIASAVATGATADATVITKLMQRDATVSKEVADLMAQVARLEAKLEATRRAADQQARQYRDEIDRMTEEHDKERAANAATNAQLAGALESAEQKAARAEAEAKSYRPSLFGFYRKEEKPRLEG